MLVANRPQLSIDYSCEAINGCLSKWAVPGEGHHPGASGDSASSLTALGIEDPILVGHSWGGAIALAYALLYPDDVSALVLLAPAAYRNRRLRFGSRIRTKCLCLA